MNYIDTLKSAELVISTGEVPLIVGESGIGKTALAKELAKKNKWSLIVIDGNLLKEGEIGGLPTIETNKEIDGNGRSTERKITVYAVHTKLREIEDEIAMGRTVLLFIDEINRCEHTVQQELMNLILNREINGYQLDDGVKILAAMNPSSKYGSGFDYQVVDMDSAQENRFVWLYMEPDYLQWLEWASNAGIEQKVIEFISTFPEYLHRINEDSIRATPRSYERISKIYRLYKKQTDTIPRPVFLNVISGNVGKMIAQEFIQFIDSNPNPLLSFDEVFNSETLTEAVKEKIQSESHTRLFITAKHILNNLETHIKAHNPNSDFYLTRFIEFLKLYPVDLRIGIMKDIKYSYQELYQQLIEEDSFVDLYFDAYTTV
jgi:MoxR-like ATPases